MDTISIEIRKALTEAPRRRWCSLQAGEQAPAVVDEDRDRTVHQAEIDRVQEQGGVRRADGASWSLIMAAAQAVLTGAIFLLSIRRGEGGLSPADVLMIALEIGRAHV